MPTTAFPSFHAAYPPSQERAPFDPARHDPFATRVPAEVANEWRTFGFGAYGAGLLWTPEPDKPFLNSEDWPALDGTGIEVLRTAFGNVCLWQGGHFLWLNILSGNAQTFAPNAEIFFDELTKANFRKSVLLERLFKIARKRLGDLDAEECYGFAPLPALGGDIAEDYLIKAKMREYVAMAAQVLN